MNEEYDYDVIVVGAGAAGLAAAVAAHEGGASVVVVDADDKVGGSSRLSGGHFYASGTSLQRERGITDDSPDDMFEYWMTLNQWMIEPAVARKYCDSAGPTLESGSRDCPSHHSLVTRHVDRSRHRGRRAPDVFQKYRVFSCFLCVLKCMYLRVKRRLGGVF